MNLPRDKQISSPNRFRLFVCEPAVRRAAANKMVFLLAIRLLVVISRREIIFNSVRTVMEWLDSLFKEQSAFQAVVVISAIAAVGLVFSKVKWRGIGFGVAFVFFCRECGKDVVNMWNKLIPDDHDTRR